MLMLVQLVLTRRIEGASAACGEFLLIRGEFLIIILAVCELTNYLSCRIVLHITPIGVIIAQVLSLRFRICAKSTQKMQHGHT